METAPEQKKWFYNFAPSEKTKRAMEALQKDPSIGLVWGTWGLSIEGANDEPRMVTPMLIVNVKGFPGEVINVRRESPIGQSLVSLLE